MKQQLKAPQKLLESLPCKITIAPEAAMQAFYSRF